MNDKQQFLCINKSAVIEVVNNTLCKIDKRLIDHGQRVAFIAQKIAQYGKLFDHEQLENLFILCCFHDIGAYKTEEIDKLLEFESNNVLNHSVYGYCFIKNFTPLNEFAQAILYHHTPFYILEEIDTKYKCFANLINLADRIDILIGANFSNENIVNSISSRSYLFDINLINTFINTQKEYDIIGNIKSKKYKSFTDKFIKNIHISTAQEIDYVKMLVYSIDFRSENTVTHTINTTAISGELYKRCNLDESLKEKIYLGSLLHDIGKISIPISILEFEGKLTFDEMNLMKKHVNYTEDIIRGLVSDEICEIAIRHHEKLDGSGYPNKLMDEDLTTPQKIVAIADITSALTSRRSYKNEFSKDDTINIISKMSAQNKLDKEICDILIKNYDQIMEQVKIQVEPVVNIYNHISNEYKALLSQMENISS